MTETLLKYLQIQTSLTEENLLKIVSEFKRNNLETGKFLVRKGQIADCYYFIEKGFFRSYYIENKKEHTVWVESPGELVCEIKSLRFGIPTEFYIQAMEPTTYLSINSKDFDKLVQENKELQKFMLTLWETRFIIVLDAFRVFQTMDAKKRYDFTIQNFPHFQKLSLQQLSSVLGITQSSLSRIRRQK